MSITIELKPEIEAQLLAQAIAQSVSVEHLLEMLIEGCIVSLKPPQQSDRPVDPKDKLAVLKSLGKTIASTQPKVKNGWVEVRKIAIKPNSTNKQKLLSTQLVS